MTAAGVPRIPSKFEDLAKALAGIEGVQEVRSISNHQPAVDKTMADYLGSVPTSIIVVLTTASSESQSVLSASADLVAEYVSRHAVGVTFVQIYDQFGRAVKEVPPS